MQSGRKTRATLTDWDRKANVLPLNEFTSELTKLKLKAADTTVITKPPYKKGFPLNMTFFPVYFKSLPFSQLLP